MTRPAVPHRVYRCYDADDRLVYIGVTSMPIKRRMGIHRTQKPDVWAATVRVETTEYPDKATAYEAEGDAIYNEAPLLNKQHNYRRRYPFAEMPPREVLKEHKRRLAEHRALRLAAAATSDPSP